MKPQSNGHVVSIQPSDNGPLLVRGPVHLVDAEGNEFPIRTRNIALCRCGASQDKPFCDGSHRRIGFQSVVRAPHTDAASALQPAARGA
jgi:CDGSH iron-sulfur domain-containing protein 3